jgi:hypothetical protein
MTEEELSALIANEERQALGYFSGDLAFERERAIEYYNGKLDVVAPEGRSDYISTDVRDSIDGMLPDLLDVFLSSDDIVKFEPQGPEDEQATKQATDACNYVFYRQNNGALTLYEWFKSALKEKNGVVKYYYDQGASPKIETYEGLNDLEFQTLLQTQDVRVLQHSANPDPQNPEQSLHDVRISVSEGKICIEGIPSEEFLICADHRSLSLKDVRFAEHSRKLTISQIREMGYEVDDDEPDDPRMTQESPEWSARRRYAEEKLPQDHKSSDPSLRELWFSEISLLTDFDGDGIAERRRVAKAGNRIVYNDYSDHVPFAAICPNIEPYRFYGFSVADLVADIQKIKSIVGRATIDSLYQALVPRIGVMENMVNLDDLLVARPGGVIRFKTNPSMAMMPIEHRFVGQQAFPFIEYMDAVKENRTGFTRYSQGMDADSLNKTARGIQAIQTAAAKRLKLIARMFAETGLKDLFKGILHLLIKHRSGKPMLMRLRNQWVPMDPRSWKTSWDMSVSVGLGTNDKSAQAAQLEHLMMIQGSMRQNGMPHIASEMNVYNAAKRLAEANGYKNEGEFFTPPGPQNPPPQQPPPPEIVRTQMESQVESAKLEAGKQAKAAEMQNSQAIAQIQSQTNIAVAQIKAETDKIIANMKEEGAKRAQDIELRKTGKIDPGEHEQLMREVASAVQSLSLTQQQLIAAVLAEKEVVRDAKGDLIGVRPKAMRMQ